MEFPQLGSNCSALSCKRLDFLPIKCDCCGKVFCNDHYKYAFHNCMTAYGNNIQVPECPLCGVPVPIPRNQQPDVAVGAHIDRDCKWDPSKDRKVFTNKCSKKGCKTKEIIPVLCTECQNNFCLRHRHTADHNCLGSKAAVRTKMANAVITRNQGPKSSQSVRSIQDQRMSEDEALARAIALSLQGNQTDEEMSRPIAGSQRQASTPNNTHGKDKCVLS